MPRTRIAILLVTATAAAALAAAALVPKPETSPARFHGTALAGEIGADFTLDAAGDRRVSLGEFAGRAVLLFFGYTSCPDACPTTMVKLDRVMGLLGPDAGDVQVLLISVDPELDTPQRLERYVAGFDSTFLGLTGSSEQLARIARSYGVHAGEPQRGTDVDHEAHRDPARVIPHTTHLFGLDRSGRVRLLWSPDATVEEIATDVRSLLRL